MLYGTYTTIDCPKKRQNEAFEFLSKEFEKIGGYVWKKMNPHDFGSYPSFEVDYPSFIEDLKMDLDCYYDLENSAYDKEDEKIFEEKQRKYDEWHEKADKIQKEYYKKFEKWL